MAAYIGLYREKHVSTVRPGTAANINRELERMQDAWPGRSLRSISKKDVIAVIDKAMKRGPVGRGDSLEGGKRHFLGVVRSQRR